MSGVVKLEQRWLRYSELVCPRCGVQQGGVSAGSLMDRMMYGERRVFAVEWSAPDEGLRISCGVCSYKWIVAGLAPEGLASRREAVERAEKMRMHKGWRKVAPGLWAWSRKELWLWLAGQLFAMALVALGCWLAWGRP